MLKNCCCPQIFAGESIFTGQGSGVKLPDKKICTFKTNWYPATLPFKEFCQPELPSNGSAPGLAWAADGMITLLDFVVHLHKVVLTGFVSEVNYSNLSQT